MTLTDWLLARIAEDEGVVRRANGTGFDLGVGLDVDYIGGLPSGIHIDPARVLAECEAKRRIVEEHKMMPVREPSYGLYDGCCETCTAWGEYGGPNEDKTLNYCPTLRLLALPYADHPDYDEEWKP